MSEDPAEVSIDVSPDEISDPAAIARAVARALRRGVEDLPSLVIRRRSVDARRGGVRFRLLVQLGVSAEAPQVSRPLREVSADRRVVIVGDGPAGLFCALELARDGIASVVLDRGHRVQPRRRDLKKLNQNGIVDPDSNYCFGEGGAGTYSDGKLYTRAKKRGDVRDVLETLVAAGAPTDILIDARPHIGSNILPRVVTTLREQLEAVGVEFRFESRMIGLELGARREARGVVLHGGEVVVGDAVVLATGHSARDVMTMLAELDVPLEAKAFAIGVRIEHPQPLINSIQYGAMAGHPKLPAASYRLVEQVRGRGVFSFCMCPGGWIVPAATEPGGLVVNGMSLSKRDSPYANSGLVVGIEPDDLERAGMSGPLAGVALQRAIERAAFVAGGGALRAPATRLSDFLAGRGSTTVPDSSYIPGLAASNIADILDVAGVNLSGRLRDGLEAMTTRLRGFRSNDAVLVGVESRTSSPLRVPRDRATLVAATVPRLYPCGEGAGYAGGIVSAALDGVRVARAISQAI